MSGSLLVPVCAMNNSGQSRLQSRYFYWPKPLACRTTCAVSAITLRMSTAVPLHACPAMTMILEKGGFLMRRVTALCAAVCLVASSAAAIARPMHPAHQESGYYVIRWDNTGICQIWNTELKEQPVRFLSDYKVVSKPVPTFTAAAGIQEQMRQARHCTM